MSPLLGRFKSETFGDKEFCEYAVRVVEKQPGYNATVLIGYRDGQEEYFNVSANLCASFRPDGKGGFEREGWGATPCSSGGAFNTEPTAEYSTAVEFVLASFPMEYVAGYMVHHDKAGRSLGGWANQFYHKCGKATGLLTYAFLASVLLYVSLAFGEARERSAAGDDSLLNKFVYYFAPVITSCYVAVLGGCVLFYVAMEAAMRIVTPFYTECALASANTYSARFMGYFAVPVMIYILYGLVKISTFSRAAVQPDETRKPAIEQASASDGSDSPAEESNGLACLRVLRTNNVCVGLVGAALFATGVAGRERIKPIDPGDQEWHETLQLIGLTLMLIVTVEYRVRIRADNRVPVAAVASVILGFVFTEL